jgi:Zn-dependent peptidase ImmA (M78 family)
VECSFLSQLPSAGEREWQDDELRTIAKAIGVSREAVLLRLVTLGRASWTFYKTQRARFQDEYRLAASRKAAGKKKESKIPRPVLKETSTGREQILGLEVKGLL